jgi:hypothetical protein
MTPEDDHPFQPIFPGKNTRHFAFCQVKGPMFRTRNRLALREHRDEPCRVLRGLPPDKLAVVLDGVGAAIDAMGGAFTMPYATMAVTAVRTGTT